MAKFVKLGNGDYVNIDKIIKIEREEYDYLYGDQNHQKSDDDYILILHEPIKYINVNKREVDKILNQNKDKEPKISEETLMIAIDAIKNEQGDLGTRAGFALESGQLGAEQYYEDCEAEADRLGEAISELEDYGNIHLEGFGSRTEQRLKERGL